MLDSSELLNFFIKNKIKFYSGVPDSIQKIFLEDLSLSKNITHIPAANEGSAVAISLGNYLSSKQIGLTYLQNSGLGNAINPLISIAEKSVYSIPIILLIGWRGAPGTKDEPQHMAKGKITKKILSNLKIKNILLNSNKDFKNISKLINYAKKNKTPVAILVKNKTFKSKKTKKIINLKNSILRSSFILNLLKLISVNDRIISSTGYTSRELYQLREVNEIKKGKDFYMVGGMGHSASLALGCSANMRSKNIICLDGDGSMLMHMGSLATLAQYGKSNLKYILLNNNTHESVGGQSTNVKNIDLDMFSKSLGFKKYFLINSKINIKKKINIFLKSKGPNFLEVKIKSQSINKLGRPKNFKNIIRQFIK